MRKGWHEPSRTRREAEHEALSTDEFSFLPKRRKYKTLVRNHYYYYWRKKNAVATFSLLSLPHVSIKCVVLSFRPAQMDWSVCRSVALCWVWTALQWCFCIHASGTPLLQRCFISVKTSSSHMFEMHQLWHITVMTTPQFCCFNILFPRMIQTDF